MQVFLTIEKQLFDKAFLIKFWINHVTSSQAWKLQCVMTQNLQSTKFLTRTEYDDERFGRFARHIFVVRGHESSYTQMKQRSVDSTTPTIFNLQFLAWFCVVVYILVHQGIRHWWLWQRELLKMLNIGNFSWIQLISFFQTNMNHTHSKTSKPPIKRSLHSFEIYVKSMT